MKLTQSLMASLAVAAAVGLFPGSGRAADFDISRRVTDMSSMTRAMSFILA